jgi:SAM-dependent methyltransferase
MSIGNFGKPEVAAQYASERMFALGDDLAALRDVAALTGREWVVDIGTAAGHTALALAPGARRVLGLDPAEAMLHQARRLADERGIANLDLAVAFADPLPCRDGSIDLVTCRLAAHHFPDLPGAIYEVERILRPGGRFLVVDTISPEDEALDEFINEVELVRDPSHAHDYRLSEWADTLGGLGLRYELLAQWELPLDFAVWTKRIGAPPEAIARLEHLFDHASPEAITTFRITPPPDRTFCLHAAMFVGTKG